MSIDPQPFQNQTQEARLICCSATAGPDDDDPIFAIGADADAVKPREDMQTFVFSATLSKDLQQNLKKRQRQPKKGTKRASALGEDYYCWRKSAIRD